MSTTTEIKHTPGPWRRDGSQIGAGNERTIYLVGGKDGEYPTIFVSSYCSNPDDAAQLEANASLISAAPAMLEALEELLLLITSLGAVGGEKASLFLVGRESVHRAEAAMRLAKGDSQ